MSAASSRSAISTPLHFEELELCLKAEELYHMYACSQSISDSARPEIELCAAIIAWREELVSTADLQATDLERRWAPSVFKHHQFQGKNAKTFPISDDHHSPVKPEAYLQLRLKHMMTFYQNRLPVYIYIRFWTRIVELSLTASGALLAYLNQTIGVIIVIIICGALISWSEFSDISKKVERYTRAVRSIKNLLSWWDVLTDVERAGIDNISTLIETGESIISDERQSWNSTAKRLSLAAKQHGGQVDPKTPSGILGSQGGSGKMNEPLADLSAMTHRAPTMT